MTIAIGTDIVEIARIKSAFDRQGEKIVQRVLTDIEQQRFNDLANDEVKVAFLAKRWCAKEAIAKALGTGIAKGVGFQQIEISNDDLGAPKAELYDGALERLDKLGGKQALISLSDERHYSLAFCTII